VLVFGQHAHHILGRGLIAMKMGLQRVTNRREVHGLGKIDENNSLKVANEGKWSWQWNRT